MSRTFLLLPKINGSVKPPIGCTAGRTGPISRATTGKSERATPSLLGSFGRTTMSSSRPSYHDVNLSEQLHMEPEAISPSFSVTF